jgi:hypothetical protein
MIRNQFTPPKFKVQIIGAIGWSDLKEKVVSYQTVQFATRKEADRAAKELNPGEYTQGRIRVVPFEMAEDYDVYPVVERVSEKPKSSS